MEKMYCRHCEIFSPMMNLIVDTGTDEGYVYCSDECIYRYKIERIDSIERNDMKMIDDISILDKDVVHVDKYMSKGWMMTKYLQEYVCTSIGLMRSEHMRSIMRDDTFKEVCGKMMGKADEGWMRDNSSMIQCVKAVCGLYDACVSGGEEQVDKLSRVIPLIRYIYRDIQTTTSLKSEESIVSMILSVMNRLYRLLSSYVHTTDDTDIEDKQVESDTAIFETLVSSSPFRILKYNVENISVCNIKLKVETANDVDINIYTNNMNMYRIRMDRNKITYSISTVSNVMSIMEEYEDINNKYSIRYIVDDTNSRRVSYSTLISHIHDSKIVLYIPLLVDNPKTDNVTDLTRYDIILSYTLMDSNNTLKYMKYIHTYSDVKIKYVLERISDELNDMYTVNFFGQNQNMLLVYTEKLESTLGELLHAQTNIDTKSDVISLSNIPSVNVCYCS